MAHFIAATQMLNLISGSAAQTEPMNDDLAHFLRHAPTPARDAWYLRMLPAFAREPLNARIAARRHDEALIRLWELSPHLLEDIGFVLTSEGTLPDHLSAAPAQVINHVAETAPEQIVQARMDYPPATRQAVAAPMEVVVVAKQPETKDRSRARLHVGKLVNG
jgi:hypothetical protein